MKIGIWMLSALVVMGFQLEAAKQQAMDRGAMIRVQLKEDVSSALLEAKGPYRVVKRSGHMLSRGSIGKRFVIHPIADGLRWGEEYPDDSFVTIEPQSEKTLLFVDGIQYQGCICICLTSKHKICVVNEVSLENYLHSVLAQRFEKPLSDEVMAAYVIAARTEALLLSENSPHSLWDVKAQDVSYFGYGVTCRDNGVESAIARTQFMVLEPANQPLSAFCFSKVEELAENGADAKQILLSLFPKAKIGKS